jgi:DNA-binding transcriptional ArsR family regulator
MALNSIFDIQAQLCQAMSSPIRLHIVHQLRQRPLNVSEICAVLELSQPVISRHLAVLRRVGVVATRRIDKNIYYHITNPKITEICDLMRQVLLEQVQSQSQSMQSNP